MASAEQKLAKARTARQLPYQRLLETLEIGKDLSKEDNYQMFLVRAEQLDSQYNQFQEAHNKIIGLIPDDQYETEDATRKEADTTYFTIKAILRKNARPASPVPSVASPKLNKLTLPIFDGTHKLWPTFYDLFRTMVHENESLSNVAKFQYLLTSLKDEAFNLIKSLPVTEDNYLIAYNTLKGRYQNKRYLATIYYNELHHMKPLSDNSSKSIRFLVDIFKENVEGFKTLGFPVLQWDFLLFNLLLQKVDTLNKTRFETEHSSQEIPSYNQLLQFLERQAKALDAVQLTSGENNTCLNRGKPTNSPRFKPSVNLNITQQPVPDKCFLCQENHAIYKCPVFQSKSASDRLNISREHNLCRNCLSSKHFTHKCTSNRRCLQCKSNHHTLLHLKKSTEAAVHVGTIGYHKKAENSNKNLTSVILPTVIIRIQDRFGKFHLTRALIDSGSMSNFITDRLSKRLQLPRSYHTSLEIRGLNSMSSICNKGTVDCYIQPCHSNTPSFDLKAVITPTICADQPPSSFYINTHKFLQNLTFHRDQYSNIKEIDLLIGAELVPQLLIGGRVMGGPDDPVAIESVFGWILMGRSTSSSTNSLITCLSIDDVSFENTIQKFWELESLPTKTITCSEDQQCEDHFQKFCSRTETGRFMVSLPFKPHEPVLGESYQQALKRFLSLEKRLSRDPILKMDYIKFMEDYLAKGHMSLHSTSPSISTAVYFIPHHCILRPDSASTKLRVVFDASATSSNGKSLNDTLQVGPKLQQDIIKILLTFRCFKFAFICDIKQMYRQILVSPNHRDYQRILWRFSENEPIKQYILNTVTYGVVSSPFLALRTILEIANLYASEFPQACKSLKNNIYVDDIVTGASSLEEILSLQRDLITVLNKCGFELRKWASNCSEILSAVSTSDIQSTVSFDSEEIACVKVLGLQWDPKIDQFKYSYCYRDVQCTKRSILSDIARIYDPLGFLAPCTLKAKHVMQQLWQLKTSWDDSPPISIQQNWEFFKNQLPGLSKFHLPRYMLSNNYKSIQLHLFCDASQIGYCAVAYLRVEKQTNQVNTQFICAKTRVAPLKVISIPRLELCAAVLLIDLLDTLKEIFSTLVTFESITAWSDSQITLSWISAPPHKWKIFVANRVSRIQEVLPKNSWKYVPSEENPADDGSRGLFPEELVSSERWWKGPKWLNDDPSNWPSTQSFNCINKETIKEQKAIIINAINTEPHLLDSLMSKFSSIKKIKRILAYVNRFITHCRTKKKRFSSIILSPMETQNTLSCLISHVQHQHFPQLFTAILENKIIQKPYRQLSLFLDREGLLRVGGRLKNSNLPFDHKHPVLLPKNTRLSELIVEQVHREFLHPGHRALLSLVMQQFWILGSRSVIHRIISRCLICFKVKPRSYAPLMADLPRFRIEAVKAFSIAAVDFAGPIFTTLNRRRGSRSVKSYLCIFVCTATKAIHLELVSDLSTNAFIAALRRFIARRGRCSMLVSDQGTNFVGAYNRMQEMAEETGIQLGLTWNFNPPGAPHFSGLAEAGVKSVKTHLIKVIGDQILTFEEVYTVLTQIEAVLNSRPLTPISNDPNDLQALTPAHFLLLESIHSDVPDIDLMQSRINRLDRWQLLQRMVQDFWARWKRDYLHTLQQRSKWNKKSLNLAAGDLVIIKNEQQPPLKWDTGRIIEVHPGKDGIVRVATVRTSTGVLKRPATKLCPLPIESVSN
ncbi:uncharacterized protein [Onthophagus taurus]|uniref:uncharacterized protein n=1 Tax=Onthophagus taurus TaxID=166361 RepID=UPI0039BECACE